MSEQIDIAVDLGAVPPPLPEILNLEQLVEVATAPPPQIIEGVLHQGCKMILGGTSKSNKSWCLLDLALSVASGQPWWGRRCAKAPVVYINFELHVWAVSQRINALCAARPECTGMGKSLHVWNLRGHNADLTLLRPKLEEQLLRHEFGLIILDPAYKLLGNRDENANGDIAGLMNELEGLAQRTGAGLVVAHHFAKGDSTSKSAIDRMSGAGAWARDPDSILIMTPHEEEACYTVTSILRNLPMVPEFVLAWDYPLMKLAKGLDPDQLRRQGGRQKACTDREFFEAVFAGSSAMAHKRVCEKARSVLEMSERSARRYLARVLASGMVCSEGGLYWPAHQEDT